MDPLLQPLVEAGIHDDFYKRLIDQVHSGSKQGVRNLSPTDPLRIFLGFWDDLSIYDSEVGRLVLYQGDRIVVPLAERDRLLTIMHQGHPGIVKMKKMAQQMYFWPGMTNSITQFVGACEPCFELLPSQPAQPLLQRLATLQWNM